MVRGTEKKAKEEKKERNDTKKLKKGTKMAATETALERHA